MDGSWNRFDYSMHFKANERYSRRVSQIQTLGSINTNMSHAKVTNISYRGSSPQYVLVLIAMTPSLSSEHISLLGGTEYRGLTELLLDAEERLY